MKIKALKGFKDILPGEVELWQHIEKVTRDVFRRFNFSEIRLPILEETQLFARSIGEATDIVEKEMYTFVDKQIAMRPEATASLMRAYIEHSLHLKKPVQKLFTIGPMFRHERPQKGRLRQFHQINVEIVGSESGQVDGELMAMGALLIKELGLQVSLEINSLGCPECRPAYRQQLLSFIEGRLEKLCEDCKRRSTTNPLRVLDCKVPDCRKQLVDAPSIQDYLCATCESHFKTVQKWLQRLGVEFHLNKFMVRGLDYYCRTTFEFITNQLGAQAAVGAGGRYDGLVETLGGPKNSPGIGFAIGMERLVLLLQQLDGSFSGELGLDLWIAAMGEPAAELAYVLAHELRQNSFSVGIDYEGRSLKSQMKQADKAGARYVFIIGDSELQNGKGLLRDMQNTEVSQLELELTGEAVGRILAGNTLPS